MRNNNSVVSNDEYLSFFEEAPAVLKSIPFQTAYAVPQLLDSERLPLNKSCPSLDARRNCTFGLTSNAWPTSATT